MSRNSLRRVINNPNDAYHRSGINSLATSFVVKRHIAAGDGGSERGAGFANSIDGGGELRHDLRLFRVAEVKAVRRGNRGGSSARDFARRLGDSMHRSEFWIEITPAAVAAE